MLDHCFKAPADSLNIFFRCLPRFNITTQKQEDCLDAGVTGVSSKCETKRTTETTITEQPAQEDYISQQLNGFVSVIMRYWVRRIVVT